MSITTTSDVAAVYDEHFRLLVGTCVSRYGICESEAQTLAHDVFLSYITKADEIRNCRAWLIGAICNASKHYLRKRARTGPLPASVTAAADPAGDITREVVARDCLSCLTPRCQLALRLRYIEGYSVPEIAQELRTTAKYAQKLVMRCLQQAQRRYGETS